MESLGAVPGSVLPHLRARPTRRTRQGWVGSCPPSVCGSFGVRSEISIAHLAWPGGGLNASTSEFVRAGPRADVTKRKSGGGPITGCDCLSMNRLQLSVLRPISPNSQYFLTRLSQVVRITPSNTVQIYHGRWANSMGVCKRHCYILWWLECRGFRWNGLFRECYTAGMRASKRPKDRIRNYVEDQAHEEVVHLEKAALRTRRSGSSIMISGMCTSPEELLVAFVTNPT